MNFIDSISPINSNNQFCSIESLEKAEINMEDSLDLFTADLIKRIHSAYQQFLLVSCFSNSLIAQTKSFN